MYRGQHCCLYTVSGESGITGMLIGQPEVMGVTFQRPAAPPPIVVWTKTGKQPIGTMEIYTGNEHFNSHMARMFPMIQEVLFILWQYKNILEYSCWVNLNL